MFERMTAALLGFGLVVSATSAVAGSGVNLNRLVSLCQTGDYKSCTAYNQAVFDQHTRRAPKVEAATASTYDPLTFMQMPPPAGESQQAVVVPVPVTTQ